MLGLGRSPAADEVPASDTVLWDTQRDADGAEVDFGGKKSWQRVSPGTTAHPLRGDVVVENERIAVIFCRGSGGPLICPKSAVAQGNDRSRLVPVGPERGTGDSAEPRSRSERTTKTKSRWRSRLGTQGGQEIRTVYSLARGQAFVECKPIRNAARIRVEAATRFAVIPDFFGADMVFDPRAYSQSKLIIPPENFRAGACSRGRARS